MSTAAPLALNQDDAKKKLTKRLRRENEINDLSEWCRNNQFVTLVWFGWIITFVSLAILGCLHVTAGMQSLVLINKLHDGSLVVKEFKKTSFSCLSITIFIALFQEFYVFGVRFIIKRTQAVHWWKWIGALVICIATGTSVYFLMSVKAVQKSFEYTFDVTFQPRVNENSTSKAKDSFLPKRNLISYLECGTIVCNIYQIIVFILLIRWKPKNFDWIKYMESIQRSEPPKPAK